MKRRVRWLLCVCLGAECWGASLPHIETSLHTKSRQIRQFAFDGDASTFFEAEPPINAGGHFTLVLDKPVRVKRIVVSTGRPDGSNAIAIGTLEASADGEAFYVIAQFRAGVAEANIAGDEVRAFRVKAAAQSRPLAIREIAIDSEPSVERFRNPVEFVIDASRAPDLKSAMERETRGWEQAYPMICDELASPGFRPPRVIRIWIDKGYDGVAEFSSSGIRVSAKFARENPQDVGGAIVHEIAHAVQDYGFHSVPDWLVEGIADYVRFFRWRPGEVVHLNPDGVHYNGSYRISASFLNYLVNRYDADIVRKLNQALREGRYRESVFKDLTGKTVRTLSDEWRLSLPRTPADLDDSAQTDDADEESSWISIGQLGWLAGAALIGFTGFMTWRRLRPGMGKL